MNEAVINVYDEPSPEMWPTVNVIALAGVADETGAVFQDEAGAKIQPN